MERAHTLNNNPSVYLPSFDEPKIRELETKTVQSAERWRGAFPTTTEYLRDVGRVIGWDSGQDATLSYAECSGGETVRCYHGRPMLKGNPKIRRRAWEEDAT